VNQDAGLPSSANSSPRPAGTLPPSSPLIANTR
jgi:hypothetical protein